MSSSYDRAFRRLAALTDYETMATVPYHERTYGLSRMEALLRDLGRPCARRPVLQVVGSKGKGTTTAAAAAILRAAGLRVGSYVSPHLSHPSERILLDGRPLPGRTFERAVARVLPLALRRAGQDRPTFFELMTAVALLVFEEAGAGAVVLEAGMGGRLDATPAPPRRAVLLPSVSLDHVRQLGRTTARIAAEKAAAARRGVPFYSVVPGASPAGWTVARDGGPGLEHPPGPHRAGRRRARHDLRPAAPRRRDPRGAAPSPARRPPGLQRGPRGGGPPRPRRAGASPCGRGGGPAGPRGDRGPGAPRGPRAAAPPPPRRGPQRGLGPRGGARDPRRRRSHGEGSRGVRRQQGQGPPRDAPRPPRAPRGAPPRDRGAQPPLGPGRGRRPPRTLPRPRRLPRPRAGRRPRRRAPRLRAPGHGPRHRLDVPRGGAAVRAVSSAVVRRMAR